MKILITGGAGFIGSNLVRYIIEKTNHETLNIDKLTYAGNLISLAGVDANPRYQFKQIDICDYEAVKSAIYEFKPDWIMHLAAESHVDRSIDGPGEFIQTNIVGTYNLLQNALHYYNNLDVALKEKFRFLHVSTDEVFGSLGDSGFFSESTPYDPRSPYSASKASSDHLVRAWFHTFKLPALITNCSNNYGPYQFPEKLIPVVIIKAIRGEAIPVYGRGENVRDWLYVEDHVRALLTVLEKGVPGETYNIGGNNEKQNIELVRTICSILNESKALMPEQTAGSNKFNGDFDFKELISFVADRPGHDLRYSIDASKIEKELGFKPSFKFEDGIRKTVEWYLKNLDWCGKVTENKYNLERLGKA